MNKKNLTNFINKYNLGGLCNSVKVISKDKNLMTSFATDEKDLLGFVKFSDIGFSDDLMEFGIFNTATLIKVLSAMQSNIDVSFTEERGKYTTMKIVDDVFTSQLMLADIGIMDKPPAIKELPPCDVRLDISSVIIDQFVKAKNALAESDIMAFVQGMEGVDLVINYAEHNTDTITIKMPVDETAGDIPVMRFRANLFREVLLANKDCNSGYIELSGQGLMTLQFEGEGYKTKYMMVMLQD